MNSPHPILLALYQPRVLEKNCKNFCHNIARALDTVSKRGNFPGLFIMLEAVRGEGKLNLGDKKSLNLKYHNKLHYQIKQVHAFNFKRLKVHLLCNSSLLAF